MSSFRQLFTTYKDSEGSFRETLFDSWLRFNIQSALRQAEPSPRVWEQIRERVVEEHSVPDSSLSRFMIPSWGKYIFLSLRVFFNEPDLAERLDERKMQLLTKMLTMPGPGVMRLAVT